ncbi:MAG: hypothetical protein KJ950_11910 [Proteobacteria bacterium]|nr:hypothetical protein [Pseudomonadota bacterium]MBU1688036.1 hypothetical protein [Pseudomonadota bacterium]
MTRPAVRPYISLKGKILCALLVVVMGYTLVDHSFHSRIISAGFDALEEKLVAQSLARCILIVEEAVDELDRKNQEVIDLPGFQAVIRQGDLAPITRFFSDEPMVLGQADIIYLMNRDGAVLWSRARNPITLEPLGAPLKEFPRDRFDDTHPVMANARLNQGIKGLIASSNWPLMLSAIPLGGAIDPPSSPAILLVGQFIAGAELRKLRHDTSIVFNLASKKNSIVADNRAEKTNSLDGRLYSYTFTPKLVGVTTLYPDLFGNQNLFFSASIPRFLLGEAEQVGDRSLAISVLMNSLLILVVLFFLIHVLVEKPTVAIARYFKRSIDGMETKRPQSILFRDEFDQLVDEFTEVVENLGKARKKILIQSYYARIGESSSLIMHAIRNSLNPMLIGIDMIRLKIDEISLENFKRAIKEIQAPELSPERRLALIEYINISTSRIEDLFGETRDRLNKVVVQSTRIEKILSEQSRFVTVKPPLEEVPLSELILDSLTRVPEDLLKDIEIQLDPDLEKCGSIIVERIFFMQTLANLVENSAESILVRKPPQGGIQIQVECEPCEAVERVHLRIIDNGNGIHPEKITEIFNRGFSTKTLGSTGNGLHWCANTLSAMQGQIWAESSGIGKGACFHVVLPRLRS